MEKEDRGKQSESGHLSNPADDDKASTASSSKASRKFKTPEEIIQQDARKAKARKIAKTGLKRKADIFIDLEGQPLKKPTRLGPILSERFGGGMSSASHT